MKRFLGLLLVALLHSPLASYAQEGANDNHQPQRYKVGDHYKAKLAGLKYSFPSLPVLPLMMPSLYRARTAGSA